MHTVAVLAFDGVISFDVTTALEVFGSVLLDEGLPGYRVLVAGPKAHVTAGPLGLVVPHRLAAVREADTIIVPGLKNINDRVPDSVIASIREAHERGARVASICVGALTLADAGLLDGITSTTHWQATDTLRRRAPLTRVNPDVLYVDEGNILTSAGAAAGIDLCLHLVRRDYGTAIASDSARRSVVPLTRDGGQAQYLRTHNAAPHLDSLAPFLSFVTERIGDAWTTQTLATAARLSTRTLNRRFHNELSTTPLEWVNRERVRQAQLLLERGDLSVETIAAQVGFGSAVVFRAQFRRVADTTPGRYRAAFR